MDKISWLDDDPQRDPSTPSKRTRLCMWQFRDTNCNARTDLNFDIFGNSTTLEESICDRTIDSCQRYQNVLRYGGVLENALPIAPKYL